MGKVKQSSDDSPEVVEQNDHAIIGKSKGGWTSAVILLVNQGLATLAFFGVGLNLVLFLTRILGQDNATAANGVSHWIGTVYLCSLIGGFLSDSYWGRYLTCTVFQFIFVLGLVLVSVSSSIWLLKPTGCGNTESLCSPTSSVGESIFNLSIYLMALGYGGHQSTLATLGSDQFDEEQQQSKATFFCFFYFALNAGSLFSNTILVYFEDRGKWTVGFLVSTGSAVVALVSFLLATPWYRFVKPCGNPLPRVAQVFVAAVRKRRFVPADTDDLYEVEGTGSAIKGSRKILHSNDFKFLDKAATRADNEKKGEKNSWRLCTVTQVEEVKSILRMLPIWLCTIIYSVIFTQMASLFVEQGAVMKSKVGNFHIPAASMSVFDILSVLIFTGIYQKILIPSARRLSQNPKGLTELQRMGTGMVIGLLAMVAAGFTELERLSHADHGRKTSSLNIFWQVPQYALVGVSEVFMYVGQLEFFNGQAPDGLKSFGSSLCMASIALGNFVSSFLVHVVMAITEDGEEPGWIPADLNQGHLERFYFLIAGLTAIDLVVYVFCSRWYRNINFQTSEEEETNSSSLPKV